MSCRPIIIILGFVTQSFRGVSRHTINFIVCCGVINDEYIINDTSAKNQPEFLIFLKRFEYFILS